MLGSLFKVRGGLNKMFGMMSETIEYIIFYLAIAVLAVGFVGFIIKDKKEETK